MTDFYEQNASDFFNATVDVDMSPIYEKFLPLVPARGHILDAGCGSGRDAKRFVQSGYEVTAIDASHALCELASAHIGQHVHCIHFNEMTWHTCFDAVWACASLLHLTEARLPDAMQRLLAALKPGGVMYCSFKWGDSERANDGRHFIDMNEGRFELLLSQSINAGILELWKTDDRRPGREDEKWLNAILRKGNPA